MPFVSVIISTKNEEANIRRCLDSIRAQSFSDYEIIVVDNNSNDRTKAISQEYTSQVYNQGPERSAQRNHGMKLASGTYILYLDADMVLSPHVLTECVETMTKDPDLVGLYIPEKVIGSGFWIQVRRFERGFYDGTAIDAVRFLRRADALAIGGFDEALWGGEDWDLDLRLKQRGKTANIRAELCHNEGDFDIWRYVRKKAYYAKSLDAYVAKWGRNHAVIRRQLGIGYRYIGVFIEDGKAWKLARHPILTAAMYALRIMVGIVYLMRPRSPKS